MTRQINRREKLLFYQQMPSVLEYVIVEQETVNAEIHRRRPDGRWVTIEMTWGETAAKPAEFKKTP